tara:strand:+ start:121 stop:555 length:435 start_codon:yes stop_codon:yes gene_type:complete
MLIPPFKYVQSAVAVQDSYYDPTRDPRTWTKLRRTVCSDATKASADEEAPPRAAADPEAPPRAAADPEAPPKTATDPEAPPKIAADPEDPFKYDSDVLSTSEDESVEETEPSKDAVTGNKRKRNSSLLNCMIGSYVPEPISPEY